MLETLFFVLLAGTAVSFGLVIAYWVYCAEMARDQPEPPRQITIRA